MVLAFIKTYINNNKPRTVKLVYSILMSYLKYQKRHDLIKMSKEIKLPKVQNHLKKYRNWLLFCILISTGMRVSELLQFNKQNIIDNNKHYVVGKGNKTRVIYLNEYIIDMIKQLPYDYIAVKNAKEKLSTKQIYMIIHEIGKNYFYKDITTHSLRRSYATNLLRNNVNLEIIRKSLGHSNINTTATYLQFNDDEIIEEVARVFNYLKIES